MVVDDEPDLESLIQQRFRKKIRANEYDFIFAANGLEALAKLLEHPEICIVLSDINMPEMDGLTLLAKLNELKNPALKTVIVSAYGDMENIRTAMNRGAFDFVTKPVDFVDLETTIQKTIDQLKVLRQAQQDHDRLVSIQRDLNIARDIQQSILPKVFPPFPARKEFDLYASMTAAKSVGGDFYDFFLIDQERLGLVIGDVSGKGVPAAIFMAVSRTLMRATAIKGLSPKECMAYVNTLLSNESTSSMFVTMFYGILNTVSGEFEYTNGGHNPPYILSNGNAKQLELTDGMALGIIEGSSYESKTIVLKPSDVLFLYTDGVTEAMDTKEELYSDSRLEKLLVTLQSAPVGEIIHRVVSDVHEYSTGVEQSDDITVLAMRYGQV
jgi:sigma-B regulation protein RsbU (phosphoserine phosphatase)